MEKIKPDMETKYYEIHLDDFMDCSPIPLKIRIRLALEQQGMLFTDTGKPSLIANENPIPLGEVEACDDHETRKRYFRQTLPKEVKDTKVED